jgi:hypothetical protein
MRNMMHRFLVYLPSGKELSIIAERMDPHDDIGGGLSFWCGDTIIADVKNFDAVLYMGSDLPTMPVPPRGFSGEVKP